MRLFNAMIICFCLFWGCSSKVYTPPKTVEGIFSTGLEAFNDENYIQAQRFFDIIKLQYPASKYADDAQYYLAEINYKKGEYILAAYNYNALRRTFPNSEYAKISAYKAALSQSQLSPKYDRDQDYTKQAIKSFAEFQSLYPKDSLSLESTRQIRLLKNKLAEHDFTTAELYIKLESPRSALTYFDYIITHYSDTDYYEQAFLGKIKMLIRLKRQPEAKETVRLYKQHFANGKLKDAIESISGGLL